MHISLKNNHGFSWYQSENIFVKGYFFDENDNFLEKNNALLFLSKIRFKEDFLKVIHLINGCFTIIIKTNTNCFVASDTTRIFPIFYTFQNGDIHISDDIIFLKKHYQIQNFDKIAELELKSTLHTYGKKTLLKNVYQIQSSEYLIIKNEKIIENNFFFSYASETNNPASFNTQKKQAFTSFENTFKRLIKSLNNKTVALPLSSGFDSRLIAVMLKKYNYSNVICYTYGKKDSFEIENSKKTAKYLGHKWLFVEYSENLLGNILNTTFFKNYANYAGKYSAMPNPQEYFAVHYLKENKLIPNDTIFIPGYAGDFLGGSQFLKVIPKSLEASNIINLILREKFTNYKLKKKEKKHIRNELEIVLENDIYKNKIPSSIFEDIDIKEKITKYIFNSANFYTFFGYEHRFPFWDKELLTFFKRVPEKHKIGKILFDTLLINHYFKPFKVSFKEEIQPSLKEIIIQKIKNNIKSFLPLLVKKRLLEKNSWINYKPIITQLESDIKKNDLPLKRQMKSYNEVIIQWYVFLAKNKLK
jgi:asparagine synthase (glutamine-hydrolysing)